MKTTNTAKKNNSQSNHLVDDHTMNQNTQTEVKNTHIKIAKPRPTGTEGSVQGPRDCFPLG